MAAAVTLPRLSWGDVRARRRALLVHGLGSTGALMWRYGVALADAGWLATAVDLRGHGTAPRTLDYSIDAYAADVGQTRTDDGDPWDLVIGHSLGGAAVTVASAADPDWTRRVVLIDPAIHLADRDRENVRVGQEQSFADPSIDAVRAEHPSWHALDVELKARAAQQASRWAVEQTSLQNTPWDVRAAAARLSVPTHVIAADPEVFSIFQGELAAEVLRNPLVTMSVVTGAGHSPHRDLPEDTMRHLLDALG
ncbi:pimeloyl-ACP methyl ester carboxylesterase [Microbacterium sp. AG790]|uniref:alpha/beta fold hydrolase n=1 Tax=Microbacterium sp. AG790 TaxID=2183995 RepID=UPI000EB59B79|nr:alpha/beta hydrolase [Microbacterium sp. AG790]RKS93571.1 pimeloyl-ACP methyl ester carboxylesterase [Microbacterium sp. AG790]